MSILLTQNRSLGLFGKINYEVDGDILSRIFYELLIFFDCGWFETIILLLLSGEVFH